MKLTVDIEIDQRVIDAKLFRQVQDALAVSVDHILSCALENQAGSGEVTDLDGNVLGTWLVRTTDERGRAVVLVPTHWRGTDEQGNRLPMTTEERLRVALVRMAGCPCRSPLLGYTGGKLVDGPRCRMCGCGVVFEEEE